MNLSRLYARRDDMERALRVINETIRQEEARQSKALGYCIPLRGQQLMEAMSRKVAA